MSTNMGELYIPETAVIITYFIDERDKIVLFSLRKFLRKFFSDQNLSTTPFTIPTEYDRMLPQGPIAQRLEQSAHNLSLRSCACKSLTRKGGTGINVPKAQPYLEGKPKGDNSMVV